MAISCQQSIGDLQNTNYILPVQNVFDTTGTKELIGMFVRVVTAANVTTNFSPFVGQEIQTLELQIDNYNLYQHTTSQHAKHYMYNLLGVTPYDSNSLSWQYFIAFSNDLYDKFMNKGTPGVSLSKYMPNLVINSTLTTGTFYIYMSSVNKCTWVIDNGTCKVLY